MVQIFLLIVRNWEESLQGEKVDLIIDSIGPATF